ncbi:MAG: oligosaccharide flippase family protein [Bacteroidales bacterium]|nr:oligosaccharide flippase family protein [Bacteroidales bacterium]
MKIKHLLIRNIGSEFRRNVFTQFTGSSISQLIPFLIAPLLTRLFSPDDYGVLALFTSTSLLIGNIATLQYDQAIILPKEEKDAINLMALSFYLVTLISILSLIIIVIFQKSIANLMNNQKMLSWLIYIPLSVFLIGSFRLLNSWATRKKQFKRIAFRTIAQSSTTASSKVFFGLIKIAPGGLIIGTLIGQFTSTIYFIYQIIISDKIKIQNVTINGIKSNCKKYKNFPIYTNWQSFFNMFSNTSSHYIISNIYGAAILGWYSFTFGLLLRPLSLFGQSVSNVFYAKIADTYNKGEDIWPIAKKILYRLLLIGISVFLPIMIFGDHIFVILFGHEWLNAGKYAQLLSPWLFAKFIFSPISTIPNVIHKQKDFFIILFFMQIMIPISFYFLSKAVFDFKIVLFITSIFGTIYIVIILFWLRKITKKNKMAK